MNIIDILEQLENNTKRTFKEQLLLQNKDDELLKRIMFLVYDPYTTFYVSKVKKPKATVKCTPQEQRAALQVFVDTVLPQCINRKVVGNAAKDLIHNYFYALDELTQKWSERILIRNLRCGVQITTINKIWPGLIKTFDVQLASTLDYHCVDDDVFIDEKINYPVFVEPKLDGLRLIVIKHNNVVTMFTRNGTQIETLPRLKKYFEDRSDIQEMVFDGEGTSGGDANEDTWNESVSVMMAYKNTKGDKNFIYNVFDCISYDDWENKTNIEWQEFRRSRVNTLFSDKNIVIPTNVTLCHNDNDVRACYKKALQDGYEGVMLKDMQGVYTFDRGKEWMKLKPIATYEGVIVDTVDGTRGAKREGKFGGFVVLLPNGATTEVGSGMSDKFKDEVEQNRKSYIGRIVECGAQPPLTQDGKMRFPRFLRFREASDVDQKVLVTYDKWLIQHE